MRQSILNKIARKRLERNFSQSYMASQLNISQDHYNELEKGKAEITLERVLKIVRILDISITELLDADTTKSV